MLQCLGQTKARQPLSGFERRIATKIPHFASTADEYVQGKGNTAEPKKDRAVPRQWLTASAAINEERKHK